MARPRLRTDQLRQQILDTARSLLESHGPSGLRARQVAAAANTSTASLYELVGSKRDLARELFFLGFRELDSLVASVAPTGTSHDDVVANLATVREWGLEHPRLFELLFSTPVEEFRPSDDELLAPQQLRRRALGLVECYLDDVNSTADPVDVAIGLLALNRGLIVTELAGQFGRTEADRDRRWRAAVAAHLAGLTVSR